MTSASGSSAASQAPQQPQHLPLAPIAHQLETSPAEALARDPELRKQFIAALTQEEAYQLEYEWNRFWARPKQVAPPGDWFIWLILAGRGFGKSKTGAQTVRYEVERGQAGRIALIGETAADARDVMVEGESGILASAPPWFRPRYEPSKRRLTWPNGAIATTYSADDPEQLRGPQHDFAWGDEVAKWRYAAECNDQLMFGLRLGANPRAVYTTTPKPIPLLKELLANPKVVVTKGSTFENRGNLAPKFLDAILRKYQGTRLGRQELEAELLDDAPGALWKREALEADRVLAAPALERIVVAIDPSVSAESDEAETGIVAAGRGTDGHAYILSDLSLIKPTPEQWANAAINEYKLREADRIIGEVNNGGDLVEMAIRAVDRNASFKQVRASRGKAVRAEPIAALYEQHRVHHVGTFAPLEDQLCQWEPGVSTWSPNRLDALVWALTELMLGDSFDGEGAIHIRSNRWR